jgi:hypothetical protein
MVDKPLDLSVMTLDWVNAHRGSHLLYMHFVRDMDLSMIAMRVGISIGL